MYRKMIFILCSLLTGSANSASTFDQRQTGDLNVQVDLKDLQIFALMKGGKEEYVDYDYAYDYSEMTIKPQNGTTPKPANGTSTATSTSNSVMDNTTVATTLITEQTTLSTKNNNSLEAEVTSFPAANSSITTVRSSDIATTEGSVASDSTTTAIRNDTSSPMPSNSSNCKKGFVLNHKGDCELKLHGTGNALLKLVKLSQKLKLRRENRRNPGAASA